MCRAAVTQAFCLGYANCWTFGPRDPGETRRPNPCSGQPFVNSNAGPDGGARRSAIPSGASRAVVSCSGGAPLRVDLRLPPEIPAGSLWQSRTRSHRHRPPGRWPFGCICAPSFHPGLLPGPCKLLDLRPAMGAEIPFAGLEPGLQNLAGPFSPPTRARRLWLWQLLVSRPRLDGSFGWRTTRSGHRE
ncbi:hypothetical protein Poly24_52750 [Rosistilla carotiformis]|uniref:Uncharacterized protein n=1 Tax=Rosistilla carotiformis TaxID=2528017 RepID=A0A518K167_9BACT|nr:hypothetical protein Poly24_52750 [Rosistilla carotiformis]